MIPLTVLGGYLGAGKTTILNKVLSTSHGQRVAVLINDFGAINIDAALVRAEQELVVELTNGCVCCSVQDDLGGALEAVRQMAIDQVIIEASGVALPAKVADYGHTWPGYRPGNVLVAVDASNIERQRQDKFIGQLIADQLIQADLLIVTKLDLLPTDGAAHVLDGLSQPYVAVSHGELAPGIVFDLQPSMHTAHHRAAARHSHPDFHAFTATRTQGKLPRNAVEQLLDRLPPTVTRVKGWFSANDGCWLVQGVGDRRTIEPFTRPGHRPDIQLVFTSLADRADPRAIAQLIEECTGIQPNMR